MCARWGFEFWAASHVVASGFFYVTRLAFELSLLRVWEINYRMATNPIYASILFPTKVVVTWAAIVGAELLFVEAVHNSWALRTRNYLISKYLKYEHSRKTASATKCLTMHSCCIISITQMHTCSGIYFSFSHLIEPGDLGHRCAVLCQWME